MSEQTVTDTGTDQETTTGSASTQTTTTPPPADWRTNLSEDLRTLPSFEKFKSPDELAKSYLNLEKTLGKEKIPMPKDEKDQAGWDMVYSRLGRPESADKYDLKMNLAEGLEVGQDHLKGLKEQSHKLGLSSKQLQGMIDYWSDIENTAHSQRQESSKQSVLDTETNLRRSLGANYESAKKNVEAFIRSTFPKTAQEKVLERVKSDPEEFEAYFNASKSVSEDVLKVGKPLGLSPAEADLEYKRILADTKGPYYDQLNPEHEHTKKRMFDLLQYMDAGNKG